MAVSKAAGVAVAGQRFHEDVGLRRDGRGFLANRLQLLTIVIGKGFGLALAVEDFAQQVDAGSGIFRRVDLIVDKQHRNVQGAELVDDAALHQRWPGAQLGDHQIRLAGDDAFKIDIPLVAEAHVKDRGRLRPRRFQHLPGGNVLLFRQIIPCHQPLKWIVPVQQGEGHNVAAILQNNTLRLFSQGDLPAVKVGNRQRILGRIAEEGCRDQRSKQQRSY